MIGTSPKICPGTRLPMMRSMPSMTLVTSMRPASTTNNERSSP